MTSTAAIDLTQLLDDHLKDLNLPLQIPPPVIAVTQGEVIAFDAEQATLTIRYPILAEHLNPYGTLQGGMIATAIDNTIGPLSMLVAPPNYTRHLELKYRRPIRPEMGSFTITGKLLEQDKQQLTFEARVFDDQQRELVRAKAKHWIVNLGEADHG